MLHHQNSQIQWIQASQEWTSLVRDEALGVQDPVVTSSTKPISYKGAIAIGASVSFVIVMLITLAWGTGKVCEGLIAIARQQSELAEVFKQLD